MGSTRSKIKEKIGTNCFKSVKWQIFVKNRPTLGQIISGTECDRDNLIFSAERGVNKIELGIKKGPKGVGKCQKRWSIEQKFTTIFKYGSVPPLPQDSDFMMLQSCLDVSDNVHLMPDFHFKMMEVHVYETVTNY